MPWFRNPGRTGGHHLGCFRAFTSSRPAKTVKNPVSRRGECDQPTVSAEIPPSEAKIYQVLWQLIKEYLQQPQNQVAAAKLRNLQWALKHCQSIFGQVVIAISRGIK